MTVYVDVFFVIELPIYVLCTGDTDLVNPVTSRAELLHFGSFEVFASLVESIHPIQLTHIL